MNAADRRPQLTRAAAAAALAGALVLPAVRRASAAPAALSPQPTAAEAPFIAKLETAIPARFASLAAATAAGYFAYTPEDETGAISYVNPKAWKSLRLELPNQLWYDVNGRLLGVDYTIFTSASPKPPAKLFGYPIEPGRWRKRHAHVHYGYVLADGTMRFGSMPVRKFIEAGGAPSPDLWFVPLNKMALNRAGLDGLSDAHQVKFVFLHPEMWDLVAWVLPNPAGAWADANPKVVPSEHARKT